MKYLAISLGVLLLGMTVVYFVTLPQERVTLQEALETQQELGAPTFTWSYREFEENDIPRTEISLTAMYENGSPESKVIDTVEGTCNEYEERDNDAYEHSEIIICYYAGLGRYFKVVREGTEYVVQRKIFEEGSPDYDSPALPYETLTRF